MEPCTNDFIEILKVLTEHNVEFIVVGGVCAVLRGAPVTTFDLDIVYNRDLANIERLVAALDDLGAIFRGRGDQRISPTAEHLAVDGHYPLLTRSGPLDVLASIGQGHTFDRLRPRSSVVTVESYELLILNLPDLIEVKLETVRDKDNYSIIILQQVLKEREQQASNGG